MAGECCEGSSLWQGEEQVTFMLGPRLHELQQGLRYELSQLEELIGTLPGCEPLPLKEERWIGPLPRKEEPLAHVRKEVPLVQAGKQEALAIAEQVEARALGPELHLSCPRRVASPLQEEQGSTLLAAIAEDDTGDDARHLQGKRTSWGQLAPPRKVSNLSDSDGGLPEGNSTRSLLSAGPPMTPPPPLLNRGSSCAAIVAKRGKEGSKERVKVARRGGSDMVRQSSPSSVPEDSEFTGAELPRHQFQSYSYLGSELCANDSANSIQSLLSKGPDGHLIGPHRASEVESPLVDRVQFPPYLRGMSGIPDRGRSKSPERRPSIGTSGGGSDAGTDVFRLSSNTSIMMDLEDQKRLQLARKRQISDHLKAAKNAGKPNKHGLVSKFVQSSRFEITFGIAIVMSALLSGVEAQWMSDHIGQDQPLAFFLLRQLLTFIFVIELFFRIWADGLCNFFCSSSWYWGWLDLVVVIISLVELTFDLLLMQGLVGKNGTNNIGELRVIRAIRITRLARAFRLQRLIRFIASLRTLVYSISVTLKSLFWAMVLLLMIMYVFAISFTQYASEYRGEPDVDQALAYELELYWGRLDRSMFTLFQTIAGGISWREAVLPLEEVSFILVVLFTLYVAFTYFAVLNVVTGVFCSSAIETTQKNPDLVARSIVENRKSYDRFLKNLFDSIDKDKSGKITLDELEQLMHDEMMRAYFAALEIEFSDAWTLFRLLDADKGGAIEIEEFVYQCSKLRGGASSIQAASISHELRSLGKKIVKFQVETDKKLADVAGDPFELVAPAPGTPKPRLNASEAARIAKL